MGIFDFLFGSSSPKKPSSKAVQDAIDRLSEDEALTSGVEDEGAKILLQWAKERLQHWHEYTPAQDVETFSNQLRLILRMGSRLTAQRQELSEVEFLDQLIQIVDAAFSLPNEEE